MKFSRRQQMLIQSAKRNVCETTQFRNRLAVVLLLVFVSVTLLAAGCSSVQWPVAEASNPARVVYNGRLMDTTQSPSEFQRLTMQGKKFHISDAGRIEANYEIVTNSKVPAMIYP